MTIQQVTVDDFPKLYALWQEMNIWVYPEDEEKKRFESMFSLHPTLMLKLVTEQNIIVGSILGTFDGRTATIHRLAIHPSLQKKGYGKKLIEALEDVCRKQRVQRLSGNIHKTNPNKEGLLQFYGKQGFVEDEVITITKKL